MNKRGRPAKYIGSEKKLHKWISIFNIPEEQMEEFLKNRIDKHIGKMEYINTKKIASRMLKEIGLNPRQVNDDVYYSLTKSISTILIRRDDLKKISKRGYIKMERYKKEKRRMYKMNRKNKTESNEIEVGQGVGIQIKDIGMDIKEFGHEPAGIQGK